MRTHRSQGRFRRRGFTLIEMLVVAGILAVLATLVISVGSYVRTRQLEDETRTTMRVVQLAINAHAEANRGRQLDVTGPDDNAKAADLYQKLTKLAQARDALQNLPKEAMENGRLCDAWGVALQYKKDGGPGGSPVLISAGPDGQFDVSHGGTSPSADDIRSDDR